MIVWARVCPECRHVDKVVLDKPGKHGTNHYCLNHEKEPGRKARPRLGFQRMSLRSLGGKVEVIDGEDLILL